MFSFVRRRTSAVTEALLVAVLVSMVAGLTGLTAFAQAAPRAGLAAAQTLEGTLSIRHGDDFTSGRMLGHAYFLLTRDGETELTFAGTPPDDATSGAQVRVRGVGQGKTFNVAAGGTQVIAATTTTTSSTGVHKVAIVLFNFSNDTTQPYTPGYADGVAFTNTNSVAAYYAETSWNQLTLSGDVLGWYTIPNTNANCAYSTWANSANTAAAAAGVDLSTYDNVVYAFPSTSCGWAGLANMPGRNSWLNGNPAMSLRVMAHELGHNFGTHHASELDCTEGGVRASLSANSANCTTGEYGDPFSVMGMATRYQHTNFARGNFNWLAGANSQTVTSAGDYVLAPVEVRGAGVSSLRIQRTSSTWFNLEFRQTYGSSFDTFSATAPVVNGVTIRITPDYSTRLQSQLVDTTPATSSFSDAPLGVGLTLIDPLTGVSITTVSVSSTGALVRVSFGGGSGPTPSPSPTPTPTPTPTSDTVAPTAPANLNAATGKGKKVGLSWAASSDNIGVAGYRVYRNGSQVGTTSGTSYTDNVGGKNPSATYYVVAYDAAGNLSPASNPVAVN